MATEAPVTGLLGASSLVGECVLPLLRRDSGQVVCFSRKAPHPASRNGAGLTWVQLGVSSPHHTAWPQISHWLCLAPIWVLPDYFPMLERHGARRVVALSSTSRFSKMDSPDPAEKATAARLAESEDRFQAWAESRNIDWVILRPTLIYGHGRDRNISRIAQFAKRFGFFPLLGQAQGLRQPVHAEDVAAACFAALHVSGTVNRAYDISGGETLPYREMVVRVFSALRRRPRLVPIPLVVFRMAVACLRWLPAYRHGSAAMAQRMNLDLVFDHADAARDLGFLPRPFQLMPKDLPG